ncbi:MAG: glycosyltransferase family 39 protein [Anaerolineae bacterium]
MTAQPQGARAILSLARSGRGQGEGLVPSPGGQALTPSLSQNGRGGQKGDAHARRRPRADLVALAWWAAPYAAILVAFAARVAWLGGQSLWSDEYITLVRAGAPFGQILADLPVEHMPLYFLLLHAWFAVAGSADTALRFPSVIWGVLAVPFVYLLGKRVFGRSVGLLGALFFALNPFQVWYSQDARMYSQLAALSIAALWALDVGLRERGRRAVGGWLAYVAFATLALYTHYYAVLALAVAFLYAMGVLWLTRRPASADKPAPWRAFLLAEAAIALLFLPWLPRALGILSFPGWREPVTATVSQFVGLYTFGSSVPPAAAPWLNLGALAIYLVGLASLLPRRGAPVGRGLLLALAAIVVPALAIVVLLLKKPDFHPRYFIAATPVYSLVLAQGVVAVGRRARVAGVVLAAFVIAASLVSLSLWYTDPAYAKAYYKNYLRHILEQAGPSDALLLQGPSQFLARRYGSDTLNRTVNLQSSRLKDQPPSEIEKTVADVASQNSVVWLSVEQPLTPGLPKAWLDAHGYQFESGMVGDIGVFGYAIRDNLPPPAAPQALDGAAPLDLTWSAAPNPARPGEIVAVLLRWTPGGPVAPDLKVSLRLVGPNGGTVWQRDRAPGDGSFPSSAWQSGQPVDDRIAVRLPADLAPGDYTWRVVVYDAATVSEQASATLGPLTVVGP